jgi:phage tail-like protein
MAFQPIPSARLDDVRSDFVDSTQGAATSQASAPFALSDGQTLQVKVDGGSTQTVTFNAVDFDNITIATADEVASIITNGLSGASAVAVGGAVKITSATYGVSSSIEVTGGTANSVLGYPAGVQQGTDATGLLLMNRVPEPTESGAPVDVDVDVDIFSTTGTAPATTAVDVHVDGALAYDGDGGGFQSGFSGSASNPDAATLRFSVGHTLDFDPDVTVEVRVVVTGSPSLDETYSFTTQDLVQPGVSSILAVDKRTIRVTFTEAVAQVSAAASNDALNPANYAISRDQPDDRTPMVDVAVSSVAAVDATSVELTADVALTFGQGYLLTVTGVEDVAGNVVLPGLSTDVAFDAHSPPFPDGRSFSLWEFIPQMNRLEDFTGALAKWVAILQEVANVLISEMDDFAEIIDPDFAAEQYLDAMLIDLGNPFEFVGLTVLEKRRLVQLLVAIYKEKGTEQGIIDVVQLFLGLTVTIDVYNTQASWVLGCDATQARIRSANAETFALSDGQTLVIRVDDETDETVEFNTAEFVAIGAATAAEVAAVIHSEASGVTAGAVDDGTVLIQRESHGAGTSVQVVGGMANSALGFPTTFVAGAGTTHASVSELGEESYLAPGTSRLRYTFEVVSAVDLTQEQRDRITDIVDLMKPAHTHLARIVEPATDVEIDHLELGMSWLGASATDPGTWVLH